jgi:hypothetical protein
MKGFDILELANTLSLSMVYHKYTHASCLQGYAKLKF